MKIDYETIKKTFENPMSADYLKSLRTNMVEGITKASEYHTQMIKGSVEAMNKMHEFWLQSMDWYIDSHKKMTGFFTERMTQQDTKS